MKHRLLVHLTNHYRANPRTDEHVRWSRIGRWLYVYGAAPTICPAPFLFLLITITQLNSYSPPK